MAFLRFCVPALDADSGEPEGLVQVAYRLRDEASVALDDRNVLAEVLRWLEQNLEEPDRFNRTTSKGAWRRSARGLSWFKDTARDHLERMRELARVLDAYGYAVTVITETRIGYIVYEDRFQVVAEPFADTKRE